MTRFKTTAALVLWMALTAYGSEVSTISPTQAFEKLKSPGSYLVDEADGYKKVFTAVIHELVGQIPSHHP